MRITNAHIGILAVGLFSLEAMLWSEDVLIQKDGTRQSGRILSSDADKVTIEVTMGTSKAVLPIPMSKIDKIEMPAPPELTGLKPGDPALVISTLEPLLKKYRAMPVPWVVDMMGKVADAYNAQGKPTEANAIYSEIEKLYPGSQYLIKANVGKAKTALQTGNADLALQLLEPLIVAANKTVSPTREDGRLYGEAFLVRGEALEKKADLQGALEAYLITVTSFYHHPEVVKQAEDQAGRLRQQNPKLNVR